jgi:1-acyl-sn-glycerol-3-phosphate acyltransferase
MAIKPYPQMLWTRARRAIYRFARVLVPGLLFAVFGIGAIVLAGLVIPIALCLRFGREPIDAVAQRWIHRSCYAFTQLGIVLGQFGLEYSGFERLHHRPSLIVANHPSLLDVVFLLGLVPQMDCVVKLQAWNNPALGLIVRAAGYVSNSDGNSMVDDCTDRLRAGRSLVIFPEGSRSPEAGLREFKRGAAHIALRSGTPIVPVVITCDPPALKKGQPWYALPRERFKYTLVMGEPIFVKDLLEEESPPAIAARHVNAWLYSYFESELAERAP